MTSSITAIPDDAWTPIHYPNAIWDEQEQRLVSDAEVAETRVGVFTANAAWLVCAAIAHNSPAPPAPSPRPPTPARTGTLRAQLTTTPGRIACSAGRLLLHLPCDWPWEAGLDELFPRAARPTTHRVLTTRPAATTGIRSGNAGHTGNTPTPRATSAHPKIN